MTAAATRVGPPNEDGPTPEFAPAKPSQQGTAPLSHYPADLDAEEALLGAGLLNRDAADLVADMEPADWFDPLHRLVADAIARVVAEDERPDAITVADAARRAGADIGLADLVALTDVTPSVSSAPRYADIVRRHAKHRTLAAAAADLLAAALSGRETAITDALDRVAHLTRPPPTNRVELVRTAPSSTQPTRQHQHPQERPTDEL